MFRALKDILRVMNIGRMLSALMIIVLVLATGLRAGPMAGCMTDAPEMAMADADAMSMGDDATVNALRTCDETGKAKADAATICHGICMSPMISVDIVRPYTATTVFAAMSGVMAWHDTASSPDPHPPRPTSHI
jgi:hypothetical protein